jgi:hypothetical protein
MKRLITLTLLLLVPYANSIAAEATKTLAATIDVYVFPTKGQAADQQSKDEAECYTFAESSTGSDPFQLQKDSAEQQQQTEQEVQQAKSATQGAGAKGAVKGAAAGALIGEIANDDASEGAAYGAAAGAISARRRSSAASAQAQEQAKAQGAASQQATAEQIGNFKKAFSVCLEAKEYMVKF